MLREDQIQAVLGTLHTTAYNADKHYSILAKWWSGWNKSAPPRHLLSDTGIVVLQVNRPVAMTWAYGSNSELGHIGFTVSNPKVGPRLRLISTMFAVNQAEALLRRMGCVAIHVYSDQRGLTKIMRMAGFSELTRHDFLVKSLA